MNTKCFLLFCFLVSSCSGYFVRDSDNPFAYHNVNSIAVPMFINQSSIANISAPMTKEIINLMRDFSGLRVYSGDNKKADAVLIGVISSIGKQSDLFNVTGTNSIKIGDRPEFHVPIRNNYTVSLRLILIKNPNSTDRKIIHSKMAKYFQSSPKIVFNEELDLSAEFSHVQFVSDIADGGQVINHSQNKGIFTKNIKRLSEGAAESFKLLVLNAF